MNPPNHPPTRPPPHPPTTPPPVHHPPSPSPPPPDPLYSSCFGHEWRAGVGGRGGGGAREPFDLFRFVFTSGVRRACLVLSGGCGILSSSATLGLFCATVTRSRGRPGGGQEGRKLVISWPRPRGENVCSRDRGGGAGGGGRG